MADRPGKIFVGGLDFDIEEEEFEKLFNKFGKITEVLLKRDTQNRKSRGFGFITYENPSDADEAVKQLDKQEIRGKMIHVDHAVKPGSGGGPGGDRGRGGGFRGRGAPRGRGFGGFRGSFNGGPRGGSGFVPRGGFRGRGAPRGDRGSRGGFGGRGRGGDRPMRGGYGDDRRGPPVSASKSFGSPRRSSVERGYSDRGPPPVRRDDDRYRSSLERDRYGSSSVSDRRSRDPYPPSPPRVIEREPVSSYRDYGISRDYSPPPRERISSRDSRDYAASRSPPREIVSSREYISSRDVGIPRSSYDLDRDRYSSRDPYTTTSSSSRRDEYLSPRDSRDYGSSREPSRDYISSRESSRTMSRDYDRVPSRDAYDPYRDRISSGGGRSYGGGSPPPRARSRSPLQPSRSAYSPPPRGAPMSRDLDRDRSRDYSPGARRPSAYDSRGGPPVKRSRPDDGPSMRGPPRGTPPRMSRDGPPRDSGRGPPRGPPREGGRGGPPPFRR